MGRKRKLSEKEYTVSDFEYLIGTTHIDPENQLVYKTVAVRKYGRLIAADRRLASSPHSPTEAIHALDIAKITYHHTTKHTKELKRIENEGESESTPHTSVTKGLHRTLQSAHQTASSQHRTRENTSAHQTRNSQHRTINTSAHQKHNNRHLLHHKSSSRQNNDIRDENRRRKSERIANMKTSIINNLIEAEIQRRANEVKIPKNSREARKSKEASQWLQAEEAELNALLEAECMEITDLPADAVPIDSKFVYATKTTADNKIARYKARLTGRGDQMVEGLEFTESYCPVAGWLGIRLFMALTVLMKLTPLQLDCDLAYINAPLEERVYMNPPKGRELPPGKVWRLKKSLYGLKQSGRNWNKLLDSVLQGANFKFHNLQEDACLYVRVIDGVTTIMFIYVDDIYIAASNQQTLDEFSKFLGERFKIKILGVPNQLLGVSVQWGEDFSSVHLSIPKLIDTLLHDFDKDNIQTKSTPMRSNLKLYKDDRPKIEEMNEATAAMQKKYRTLVGTFIFISSTCRPDIAYATMILCRSMSNPGWKHWEAAMHLLAYLKGTKRRGIQYRFNANLIPFLFADADDGSDETRKTIVGFLAIIAGGPIMWKSALTTSYSFSTCESEIRSVNATSETVKLAVQLKKLYAELSEKGVLNISNIELFRIYIAHPIEIMEDNKAVILWSEAKTGTAKLKHLERNLYWIREKVRDNTIKLIHCKTEDQIADAFTKPLPPGQFESLIQRITAYYRRDNIDIKIEAMLTYYNHTIRMGELDY
jgi:hypothetical protein